jgi:amino acid transporter
MNNVNQVHRVQLVAMLTVIVLYLLAIFATLGIVNQSDFSAAPGTEYAPFDFAISTASLPTALSIVVNIGAILALLTTAVVVMDLAAITVQTTASERTFPKIFSTRTSSLTAVGVIVLITALIPDITTLIVNVGASCNSIFIGIIAISAVVAVLRKL